MNYKNTYQRGLAFMMAFAGIIMLVCCVLPSKSDITTKRYYAEQQNSKAIVKIAVDYPISGSDKSLSKIQSQIISVLQNCATDKYTSVKPKHLVAQAAKIKHHQIEQANISPDDAPKYQSEFFESITKLAENENFITFAHQTYTYEGGAHGLSATEMFTYRKSDGKRINAGILQPNLSADFKKLLAQGIKAYFSSFDEDTTIFSEYNINNMPLPESKPFLTDNGVGFIYSQYEIAPYASGEPAFVIPYQMIEPYLSSEVAGIITPTDESAKITAFGIKSPWKE